MTKLYTCLVEARNAGEAFIQCYFAYGEHLGEALERIRALALAHGIREPMLAEADPYDIRRLPFEAPRDELSFAAPERNFFPAEEPCALELPYGIIASCIEDGQSDTALHDGFTCHLTQKGLWEVAANVMKADVVSTYEALLEQHAAFSVFWYQLHDEVDGRSTQFLVNPSLSTLESIRRHLLEHELDSVQNGFVTLTAYAKEGATNINLSEHKRIVVLTRSEAVAAMACRALESCGLARYEKLESIDAERHHWHYRRPGARSQAELVEYLRGIGFEDWTPGGKA